MEVKQKEEEIEKLQEALNKLINDAGVRTRQEVCIIYFSAALIKQVPGKFTWQLLQINLYMYHF